MDFCCGMSMVARLQNIQTDNNLLIQDVPMLYCPTCLQSVVAPEIELDLLMYAHHCQTDGLQPGTLSSAIGDEKILKVLESYPDDLRVITNQRVLQEQIDEALDLLNFAQSLQDADWTQEILERLHLFMEFSNVTRR